MLVLECRLETPESQEKCFFTLFLTALRVLELFLALTRPCESVIESFPSSNNAWSSAISSGFERRDAALRDGKSFRGDFRSLDGELDDADGTHLGARPSGEGGLRVRQQSAELILKRLMGHIRNRAQEKNPGASSRRV
jgi:hypothetical protein